MAEPDCPKCAFTPMEPVALDGGVHADECPKCKGHWFDSGELTRAARDPAVMERALAAEPLRPRAGSANCPRCLKPMSNGGLVNEFLRVDRCLEHGVWLDAGEQHLLSKLLGS